MTETNVFSARFHLHLCAVMLVGLSSACSGTDTKPEVDRSTSTTTSAALLTSNPIQYGYDAAGRLVAVYDPNGNSANYAYDAAGNVLSVTQYAAGTCAIFDVSPTYGSVGSTVTITGSDFSTVPGKNRVRFNGSVNATVLSYSAQQVVVVVPSGATTGLVTLTNNYDGQHATSAQTFTVSATGPSITSFTPVVGNQNTSITVTGSGFQSNTMDDATSIGTEFAPVTTASSTQLTVLAPRTSGPITVMTPFGTTTSQTFFFQLPSGVSAGSVGFTGSATVNGAALPIALSSGTQVALVAFEGNPNDIVDFALSSLNVGGAGDAYVQIFDPNGANLPFYFARATDFYTALDPLPAHGTYVILITPENGATQFSGNLNLSNPSTGSLTINGAVVNFSNSVYAQQGMYTFCSYTGANLSIAGTVTGFDTQVFDPNGILIVGILPSGYTSVDLLNLNAGTYTLVLTPDLDTIGSASVQLTSNSTVSVAENGSTVTLNQNAYQNGMFTFSANANDYVGLGVSTFSTSPANTNVVFTLYSPQGTSLTIPTCNLGGPSSCPLGYMPTTGTYSMTVEAQAAASASIQLLLSTPVTGTFTIGGTQVQVTISRVGQDAIYTFSATAGQNVTVSIPNCNHFGPTGMGGGGTIVGTVYDAGRNNLGQATCASGSPGSVSLTNLAAGTYSVVLVPSGTSHGWFDIQGTSP